MTLRSARRHAARLVLTAAAVTALAVGSPASPASAAPVVGPTKIVSAGPDGVPAGDSGLPAVSGSGRYVTFLAPGSLLPGGPQPSVGDVYLRDMVAGTVERVSVDNTGAPFPGEWLGPATVSDDGRFVVFSGIPRGATFTVPALYVRDRQLGTTARVTAISPRTATKVELFGSFPVLTGNGRYLAFSSGTTELYLNPNQWDTVYRVDLRTGEARRVSEIPSGAFIGNNGSRPTSISENGRYVGMLSVSTNLVPGLNANWHFMVKDLVTKQVLFPNRTAAGAPNTEPELAGTVSGDGSTVAFLSTGTDVGGPVPGPVQRRLFVAPLAPGAPVVTRSFPVGDPLVEGVSISRDGHRVAFIGALPLVAADTSTTPDVYVADVADATPVLATAGPGGRTARASLYGVALAASGRAVTFVSSAGNLVPNDTNLHPDVFLRRLG